MTKPPPYIRDSDELLSLMRESSSTRLVVLFDLGGRAVPGVVEWPEGDLNPSSALAYAEADSEAEKLFFAAMKADANPDLVEEWARLPLRYHAFYSGCLLPEHPHAPAEPGRTVEDTHQERQRLLDSGS